MTRVVSRAYSQTTASRLTRAGVAPLMARLLAARGVEDPALVGRGLNALLDYRTLRGIEAAATRLADAIDVGQRLLIIADYDADGATACAVGMRGLRACGARVEYLVPDRLSHGYGLSPDIVELAAARRPDLIVTVDNGIAAHAGIEAARARGIEVLVTDHHLPAATLPDAIIVNPNQPGCDFPSKALAGVGVMFYVLMATRAELRARGAFKVRPEPNLGELLDLVALGTIADVVPLDANNRLLVEHGLARMRKGRLAPGLQALFEAGGRAPERATALDLGFLLGPRLNAAGRIADMSLGIACLLAEDLASARPLARELDRLNRERREIEDNMREQALRQLDDIAVGDSYSLALRDPAWHPGVIGLLAARLKERHHRPTFIFAESEDGLLKASGRSIPGLHLRDLLDRIDKRHPGLLLKFGGHAAAAGLTLAPGGFDQFARLFEATCRELLRPADLARIIETDGALGADECNMASAEAIRAGVWGQGFPVPVFDGRFRVQGQRLIADRHLKLKLSSVDWSAEAMLFNHAEPLPDQIDAVYRLDLNEWQGQRALQLTIEHWNPANAELS
jgi:single-stranded-DNA-specific exonuclease